MQVPGTVTVLFAKLHRELERAGCSPQGFGPPQEGSACPHPRCECWRGCVEGHPRQLWSRGRGPAGCSGTGAWPVRTLTSMLPLLEQLGMRSQ